MRARMLVAAKRADLDRDYSAGQELEGDEAAYQVAMGHAEVIEEAAVEEAAAASESPEEPESPNATAAATAHAEATGVDLSTVEGTGTGGRITKADVMAAGSDA